MKPSNIGKTIKRKIVTWPPSNLCWSAARGILRGAKYGLMSLREVYGIEVAKRLRGGSIQSFGKSKVEITDGYSFGLLRWHIMQRRCYDFRTESHAPYILDCGSNIGLSILRFKEQHPQAVIIGFEPDPTIFPLLKRNIERNNCTNVKLIEAALAISDKTVSFFSDGMRLSFVGKADQPSSPGWHTYNVPTVSLADYIDREVDFLKMNIEGAERDVLVGLGAKVRQIKQMVVEYHQLEDSQNLHEILEFLSRHKFRYVIHSYTRFANKNAQPPFRTENNIYTLAVYAHRIE
jgi:FkbM family methyltransferase